MRKFLFLILTVLVAGQAGAQGTVADYRVRVATTNGERVGYAYVTINGAFQAMADSTGQAWVAARKLKEGDRLAASFVGMESVPVVWDGSLPGGSVVELELVPNVIEEVVVTAKDRSKRLWRRYVDKIPTHSWGVGFRGEYEMEFTGENPWKSKGRYERNHVPGAQLNSVAADTFTLVPDVEADSMQMWKVQRQILLVKGIAERAVQLDGAEASNRGMVMKYRGRDEGQNVFLVIKPYFDKFRNTDDSFQTMLWVSEASGLVTRTETVSQSRYEIWRVEAKYAVYRSPDKAVRFIYPTKVEAEYAEVGAEGSIEGKVGIGGVEVYQFQNTEQYENYRN